jgi:hypothetical protein
LLFLNEKFDFVTVVCCSPLLSCGYFGSEAFLFIWFIRASDLGFACMNFGCLLPAALADFHCSCRQLGLQFMRSISSCMQAGLLIS